MLDRFPVLRPCLARTGAAALLLAASTVGAQPAPAVGAARTVIVLDSVDLTAIATLSELLQARVPGLLVQSGSGSLGAGARVTARGLRSVYGRGEPLLVVDGMRAVGTQRSLALDTAVTVSRLDDLELEHVARVEVLRGPAAAAAYGPGAANGAIVVTTRTGASGRGRVYAQAGVAADRATYPAFALGISRGADGSELRDCTLAAQASGSCTIDRVERLDPFGTVPTRVAPLARLGASRGWRTAHTAGFVAADARAGQGVLPTNDAGRVAIRANVDVAPGERVALQLRAAATRADVTVQPGEQRWFFDWGALEGSDEKAQPPGPLTQRADRGELALRATWTPTAALRLVAAAGASDVALGEHAASRYETLDDAGRVRSIYVDTSRAAGHDWVATGEVGGEARWRVGAVRAASSLSLERLGTRRTTARRVTSAWADVTWDAPRFPASETSASSRLSLDAWSARVAQRLDLGARVTLDGGVRWNRGRAGASAPADVTAGATWTVVRGASGRAAVLRAAYGASSTPLGEVIASSPLQLAFAPAMPAPCVLGCVPSNAAPPRLPAAERTRELEGGVDLALGATTLGVTAYRQRSSDVLIAAPLPPTAGYAGSMPGWMAARNTGVEAELAARVVERPALGLALAASGGVARNRAEIDDFGPIRGAYGVMLQDGYPIGGVLRPAYRWADANGDGVIGAGEAAVSQGVEPTLLGSRLPTRTATLDARLRLGRRVRAAAVVEHRGGQAAYGARPEMYLRADPAVVDRATSLDEQAYAWLLYTNALSLVERADFTRLREASVSVVLGGVARGAVLTVAGRNLLTRTRFGGVDPEADVRGPHALASGGFFGQPLPATLGVRLSRPW